MAMLEVFYKHRCFSVMQTKNYSFSAPPTAIVVPVFQLAQAEKNVSLFTDNKYSSSMTIKSVVVSPGKAAVGGSPDTEQAALSRMPCAWAWSYAQAPAGAMNSCM